MNASSVLPNKIQMLENPIINWQIVFDADSIVNLGSSSNKIYVLNGPPQGDQVVTGRRLDWACSVCYISDQNQSTDSIVLKAHVAINTSDPPQFIGDTSEWPTFNPPPPPGTPPPPIWMMLDESFPGGSCIAHSIMLPKNWTGS